MSGNVFENDEGLDALKPPDYAKLEESKTASKRLQIRINRLKSSKASLEHRAKKMEGVTRKKRTRTLIQVGGLVKMVGLLEVCGISDGDDLQSDIEMMDKAAVLLGMLIEMNDGFLGGDSGGELDEVLRERLKNRGIRMMKSAALKKGHVS